LYTADGFKDYVAIFDVGKYKKPARTMTFNFDPTGEAVDADGNFYVANDNAGSYYGEKVLVYAPGASTPFREYGTGGYYGYIYDPWGLAVSKDGTLYVADNCCSSYHIDGIPVYPPGSYAYPSHELYLPNYATPYFIALDKKGDLFATDGAGAQSSGGHVYEFKAGSVNAVDLGLQLKRAYGIAIDDKGNIVVEDPGSGVIDVFSPKSTKPLRQIVAPEAFSELAFTKNYKTLFASFGFVGSNSDFFDVIDYETGRVKTVENKGCTSWCGGIGLAVSPAAGF
jgi:sugar lactone lactonase YvrE